MNSRTIRNLQKKYGLKKYQDAISNGTAWDQSAKFTQRCKELLKSGACYLPPKSHYIHFHSVVPSRHDIPKGSLGTIEHSIKFWSDEWNKSILVGQMIHEPYV